MNKADMEDEIHALKVEIRERLMARLGDDDPRAAEVKFLLILAALSGSVVDAAVACGKSGDVHDGQKAIDTALLAIKLSWEHERKLEWGK